MQALSWQIHKLVDTKLVGAKLVDAKLAGAELADPWPVDSKLWDTVMRGIQRRGEYRDAGNMAGSLNEVEVS